MDYCDSNPDASGCAAAHRVYVSKITVQGQGVCANDGGVIVKKNVTSPTFGDDTVIFYHPVFKSGSYPSHFSFASGEQFVKYNDTCTNFDKDEYKRVFDYTKVPSNGQCENPLTEATTLSVVATASECLLKCEGHTDCKGFSYVSDETENCRIHDVNPVKEGDLHGKEGICYRKISILSLTGSGGAGGGLGLDS